VWARLRSLVHGETKRGWNMRDGIQGPQCCRQLLSPPVLLSSATSRLVRPGEGSSLKSSAAAVTGLSRFTVCSSLHFPSITSSYSQPCTASKALVKHSW